jgi:RNA polymerase II subunit A-like phosphatase
VLPVPVLEGDARREIRMHHYVKIRPHVREFLSDCQERYEIGVYTAGTREYAEQVTILLARHLVGTSRDQVDLENLRRRVSEVEQEMARRMVPSNGNADVRGETGGEASASTEDGTVAAEMKTESSAGDDQAMTARPGKRKRVAFGEAPADQRTDEATSQQLEELRRELEEAEDLERKAVEARQRLFGSRVVSRTDVGDLGKDVKSLRRIFPCGGTMAAVVDDREDVWANARDEAASATKSRKRPGEPPDNLLLVRPYHWDTFVGFADVNNASGADFSSDPQGKGSKPGESSSLLKRASSESDQQLLWTADVLRRLHERYYPGSASDDNGVGDEDDASRPSVPEILAEMRREVLRGCSIVLSGLIPIHRQNHADAERPRPTIERYVEDLGGRVLPAVTSEATHVVAAKDGTDKTLAARRVPGCAVVRTLWLMECVWSLTRRDEVPHLLGPAPRRQPPSANSDPVSPGAVPAQVLRPLADSKKENSSASSEDGDDDDEDDEFAAELENEFL